MKRIIFLVLALAMAALTLYAAGRSEPSAPAGVKTISYLYNAGSGFTSDDNNPVLQKVEQSIGVKVDMIFSAPGDYNSKLNTLIASRQLPDLFTSGASDVQSFSQEGMIVNLSNYISQYGSNLEREIGPAYRSSPVNKNGIYMICGNGDRMLENLCVRVDWLRNLGLSMPTDLDSLYNVLYGFTYNDPDRNGRDDTVGIVFTMTQNNQWDVLFGAFGIAYNRAYQLANGTVTTYMKAPAYLDAIEYLRKLYQNGVMDQEFATMPAMSAHEALWTGRCGVYGFRAPGTTNNWYPGRYTFDVPADPAEMFGYTDIKGPQGFHGASKVYGSMSSGFVVSSTARYPEACVQFLDFMATPEGDILMYLGVEGLMFEWIDKNAGTYQRLGPYVDDTYHRASGGFTYFASFRNEGADLLTMNKLTREAQAFARENTFDWPYIYTPFDEAAEYGTTLNDITAEALARLIVTTGNVQSEYQAFVRRWETEGGLEWERGATAAYRSQQ